jgi:hypothetical protein
MTLCIGTLSISSSAASTTISRARTCGSAMNWSTS